MTSSAKTVSYTRRRQMGILALVGVADIFEANELHTQVKRAVADDKTQTVRISLAQAERLDTSAVQLLFALHRDLTAAGRMCILDDASPAIIRMLALAGSEIPS